MKRWSSSIKDYIIYNNRQVFIVNKPAGMSFQKDKTGDQDLLTALQSYAKKDLFPITRTDKPVSGLVIIAKSKKAAKVWSEMVQQKSIDKTYWAITAKEEVEPKGRLEHHLIKNGKLKKSFVQSKPDKNGKLAILNYQIIHELDNYHLMEITLETGRFHQIRCQLAHIKCYIKGDVKYGAKRGNKDRTIHLHCKSISFIDPNKNEKVNLEAPVPDDNLWQACICEK